MPTNNSFNLFALIPEAANNENTRPGIHLLEYFQVVVTIATNTGDVEVPTMLDDCLGVISLSYSSVFDTGDALDSVSTDGAITTAAVTVRAKTTSIANGSLTIRGYLVGTKRSETALLNSPA